MGPIPSLLLGIQLISRLALVQHTQGVTHVGSASRVRSRLYSSQSLAQACWQHAVLSTAFSNPQTLKSCIIIT